MRVYSRLPLSVRESRGWGGLGAASAPRSIRFRRVFEAQAQVGGNAVDGRHAARRPGAAIPFDISRHRDVHSLGDTTTFFCSCGNTVSSWSTDPTFSYSVRYRGGVYAPRFRLRYQEAVATGNREIPEAPLQTPELVRPAQPRSRSRLLNAAQPVQLPQHDGTVLNLGWWSGSPGDFRYKILKPMFEGNFLMAVERVRHARLPVFPLSRVLRY